MADPVVAPVAAPVVEVGDDEVKNVLLFVIALAAQVEKIVAKGSVSLFDLPGFYSAFQAAGPALSKIKELIPQVEGLDASEMADLASYLNSNLPQALPSAQAQALVGEGLALAQELYAFVEKVRGK